MSHATPAAPSFGAAPYPPAHAAGFRRMSLEMLQVRDRADAFAGVPIGTAKPLTFLMAFQEAEPYLGLPPHAYKLVSWLVKQTMAHDWETGSRPIAFPSARLQQEFLGLSEARVKTLNRVLFEAGIFVLRDNPQGKRYGRRGPDKRIIEAYGFDLSPLAQRYDEFVRLAAAAKTERHRMKQLRARATCARRAIRQVGELLAQMDAGKDFWPELAEDTAAAIEAARLCDRSGLLEDAVQRLESLQREAEQWFKAADQASSEAVETDPKGLAGKPHITSTNLTTDLKDTVIASEGRSTGARPGPPEPALGQRRDPSDGKAPRSIATRLKLSPEELLHLAPALAAHVRSRRPGWDDILDAAGGPLRHELGISASLWVEACNRLSRDGAALALAIIATKPEGYFTRSAGSYFGGMVKRAATHELFLEKSLWGLRTSRYGRPSGRGH